MSRPVPEGVDHEASGSSGYRHNPAVASTEPVAGGRGSPNGLAAPGRGRGVGPSPAVGGLATTITRYDGMAYEFFQLLTVIPRSRDAIDQVADQVADHLKKAVGTT